MQKTVRQVSADLRRLVEVIAAENAPVQNSVRLNLDVQRSGLRRLEQELAGGRPGRRAWSLGKAAMSILPIVLTTIARQAPALDPELIARCRSSVADLDRALVSSAEGR